jgi:hypothetical protein
MPRYSEIWGIDTEWGFEKGHIDCESAWTAVVLCLVGLRSQRRLTFWRDDTKLQHFFAGHGDDLFVAHYAVAELKYLMRLKIEPPSAWFDTFVMERWETNRSGQLEAGLSAALHRRGLPHLAPAEKKELQQRILQLEFNSGGADDRQQIADYCLSDCDGCLALFRAQTRGAYDI